MSRKTNKIATINVAEKAQVFAALGDPTRLSLVLKLADGASHSIAHLTEDSALTRQAITKHLKVLEGVGFVHCVKSGRESLFRLDPEPMNDLQVYIADLSRLWDERLLRLKAFLESEDET